MLAIFVFATLAFVASARVAEADLPVLEGAWA
jgi:hypothetical protein